MWYNNKGVSAFLPFLPSSSHPPPTALSLSPFHIFFLRGRNPLSTRKGDSREHGDGAAAQLERTTPQGAPYGCGGFYLKVNKTDSIQIKQGRY